MIFAHEAGQGLHSLAAQMTREPGQKVVLCIDQFEEIFTLLTEECERQHFINLLVNAATEPQGRVMILLTLRADFYHRCMEYPRLHRLIEQHQKSVLPLEEAELRSVIRGPGALPDVQVAFEGNLVNELLFAVQEQAGALPLLQFTLEQLFLRRQGRLLTLQAYREIGGVKGALVQHAESVYDALPSPEQRILARQLFLRLVDPGLTEQDTTRRRATLPELVLPDPPQTALLRATAESFIVARLLTTSTFSGTTTIEVSHEALIREWPRLREWLRSARADIQRQQTISADVAVWKQRERPDDLLYRGAILSEAQDWAQQQTASADEVAFLHASAAKQRAATETERIQQARELLLQRRSTRRLRWLAVVLSVFLVVSVLLSSVVVVNEQNEQNAQHATAQAQQQARIANSCALARQAQLASLRNQQDQAALLASKAYQTNNNYDTRDTLFSKNNDPLLSDMVCWAGATGGFASEALPACDHALQLAPDNGNYHDSRGIARAVSGDTAGAIQDLAQFVNWSRTNNLYANLSTKSNNTKGYGQEREDWIAALKAGKSNPLKDAKLLKTISQEKDYAPEIWMNYPSL
jgi:hypothetical protein